MMKNTGPWEQGTFPHGDSCVLFLLKGDLFMKSECEKSYDRYVIANLCSMDLSIKKRAALVHDFFENGQSYYDELCDALFQQVLGHAPGQDLWLTIDGKAYLAFSQRNDSDICLIPAEDCPPFVDDIDVHLHMIRQVLQSATV